MTTNVLTGPSRPSELETAIAGHRRALLAQDAATLRRLGDQYLALERTLAAEAERLAATLAAGGQPATLSQVLASGRVNVLLEQTREELTRITSGLAATVRNQQEAALIHGAQAAEQLMGMEVRARLQTVSAQALLGAFEPASPVSALLSRLPAAALPAIRDALVEGILIGRNPLMTAQLIRGALGGNLARASTIARTETLRAYRTGTLESYRANDDLFAGWVWVSARSERTCGFCWALHGSEHPLTETMATHPACRCSQGPRAFTAAPGLRTAVASGESVFRRLSEAEQSKILGPAKLAAWQAGDFPFSALAGQRHDPIWGDVGFERSLRELLGMGAQQRRAA